MPNNATDPGVQVRGRIHRGVATITTPPRLAPRDADRLLTDELPGPAARRDVLAAALGLPARALADLTPVETRTALDRLLCLSERVRRLQEEAATDDLTGVLRRGAGMRLLQAEVDRVRRAGGRLVLAFADVDGLKKVNDGHGHQAGDRLLQLVAQTLRRRLRSYDIVMRYGGDEFVCVLSGCGAAEARTKLNAVADELCARMGREVLSIGLAELDVSDPGDTAGSLVGRADAALYRGRARRTEA